MVLKNPVLAQDRTVKYRQGFAWPSSRFTNPDGSTPITGDVILDQLTGLMWLKDANCIKTKNPSFDSDSIAGDGAVFWQVPMIL